MSETTKIYRSRKIWFFVLSMLCTVGPVLVFVIWAFIESSVSEKVVLSFTLVGAAIIAGLSLFSKLHMRSPIFLILIGLWVALDKLLPALIAIAICTILDELIFWPLYKHYKSLTMINKEIDKREEARG